MSTYPTEWDLSPLLSGDDDPKIEKLRDELKKRADAFISKWSNRDDYLTNPSALKEALEDYEEWQKAHGSHGIVGYYFYIRSTIDENSPAIKAQLQKSTDIAADIDNRSQFFELNLSKVSKEQQHVFLNAPELDHYKHYLEELFAFSPYLLSDKEESILRLKGPVAYGSWVQMLSGFLSKEERTVSGESKSFSEIATLLKDRDKKTRDEAAVAMNDILEKRKDVAEAEINAVLSNKKIDDELRNIPRPDLTRHLSDDIESSVVDALVKAVSDDNQTSRDYYELKAKLFGVDKLQYHERSVPYGSIDKKYSYEAGVELVQNVFSETDEEIGEYFKNFVTKGHVDVYPKKNKRGGAYCIFDGKTLPTYLFLNYTDTLYDVLVLAHEAGHGVHDELVKKHQSPIYCGTSTASAEVASTFMQDRTLAHVLKEADGELELSLRMMDLDDLVSSIYRQIACYRFETELHAAHREVGYLSETQIGELFQKHMKDYMGDFVEQSEGSQNWWIYWSHIRMFFYVYSYASGLLISKALQRRIKEDPSRVQEFKDFLSAGTSDSPVNLFKKAGLDISDPGFWKLGLSLIKEELEDTKQLAKKLGKL